MCEATPEGTEASLALGAIIPGLEQIDLTVITGTGAASARVADESTFSF